MARGLRGRSRPFGLRSRLLLALVATAAITLLVAALALFSPLQDRLREQSAAALLAAGRTVRPQVDAAIDADGGRGGEKTSDVLRRLAARTGASVALADGTGRLQLGALAPDETLDDVLVVLGENRTTVSRVSDQQRIALPLAARPRGFTDEDARPFFVLVLRQPDTQIARTVNEVRRAFVAAALVGLVVAIVLALGLTSTLTRRLERLREAALRLTTDGMGAPAPVDDRLDEVGDLARAMARMQEGLLRQEKARRQFVATASHELRTPLTSLSGNLELLGEDLAEEGFDREDARRQVTAAQGELRRLRNLATELLDVSRLDAGVALRSEPVELGEVVRAVGAEFTLQARERDARLEVVPARGPCWALGDPDAVARVGRILIDNALRYTPRGALVRIGSDYAGDRATIWVLDDGTGVPDDEREAIFARFRRGSTTRGEGGFGLGLAIGRELAERLGGTLALERAPVGARFVLALPIELPVGGD